MHHMRRLHVRLLGCNPTSRLPGLRRCRRWSVHVVWERISEGVLVMLGKGVGRGGSDGRRQTVRMSLLLNDLCRLNTLNYDRRWGYMGIGRTRLFRSWSMVGDRDDPIVRVSGGVTCESTKTHFSCPVTLHPAQLVTYVCKAPACTHS